MSDFYIGYLPKAPTALAGFLRRVILGIGLLVALAALVLVSAQHPFAKSTFEYGRLRSFEGVVLAQPYPTLWVSRPGKSAQSDADLQYLLVAPGKHGAESLVAKFDGLQVRLQGQLIYRDSRSMVEVAPGSIELVPDSAVVSEAIRDLGPVTVSGEIVDSKCHLGVMNPGSGKVHRDCAARCLSGGIPPIFITTSGDTPDGREQFVLVGPDGSALAPDSLRDFIAEPITLRAELLQRGDLRFLQIDPKTLRHARSN